MACSYRAGGHLAILPRAELCCVAAAGKPRAFLLPMAANWLQANAGICWTCSFSSVCRHKFQQMHVAKARVSSIRLGQSAFACTVGCLERSCICEKQVNKNPSNFFYKSPRNQLVT